MSVLISLKINLRKRRKVTRIFSDLGAAVKSVSDIKPKYINFCETLGFAAWLSCGSLLFVVLYSIVLWADDHIEENVVLFMLALNSFTFKCCYFPQSFTSLMDW